MSNAGIVESDNVPFTIPVTSKFPSVFIEFKLPAYCLGKSAKAFLNDEISYSIAITNTGNSILNNIIISDDILNLRDKLCHHLNFAKSLQLNFVGFVGYNDDLNT